jgi:hypothetical protein
MATRNRAGARRTIGDNPLESLLTVGGNAGRPSAADNGPEPERTPADGSSGRKVRATFHIPEALLEEARDVVVALSGPPTRLTLAAFAETALRAEVERLKREYNGGQCFDPREPGSLRGGRPIGS